MYVEFARPPARVHSAVPVRPNGATQHLRTRLLEQHGTHKSRALQSNRRLEWRADTSASLNRMLRVIALGIKVSR